MLRDPASRNMAFARPVTARLPRLPATSSPASSSWGAARVGYRLARRQSRPNPQTTPTHSSLLVRVTAMMMFTEGLDESAIKLDQAGSRILPRRAWPASGPPASASPVVFG